MLRHLTLATWNCFGQGQGLDAVTATRAPYRERLRDRALLAALDEPDVTCIQEVMSKDAETFFDGLGAVRVRDPNGAQLRSGTLRGSGLGVASRLPFASARIAPFTTRSIGWDRLARKGTLHVRVQLGGAEVDVLTGHLQAGYDAASSRVREAQIEELGRRVEALGSEDRAFVVAGDFNVCGLEGGKDDYAALRRALPGFDDLGARDDLPTFDPHPERNALAHAIEPNARSQRIDYLFLRVPRRGPRVRARSVTRILDRPLRERTFASDHFGLAATLEVER